MMNPKALVDVKNSVKKTLKDRKKVSEMSVDARDHLEALVTTIDKVLHKIALKEIPAES
jgi:soluble cytochrome b562